MKTLRSIAFAAFTIVIVLSFFVTIPYGLIIFLFGLSLFIHSLILKASREESRPMIMVALIGSAFIALSGIVQVIWFS